MPVNLNDINQYLANLSPQQLQLLVNGQQNNQSGRPFYPGTTANNPGTNIPSINFPNLNAVQVDPSPPAGRITYGNNKNASRTVGQLHGVGRGVQDVLPGILNSVYRGQIVQAPAVTQSDLGLLQNLGPQFAQAQTNMENIGRSGEISSDLSLLQNQGRDITAEIQAQDETTNPEYYQSRAAIGEKGRQLLSGMDPNQLTSAELTNAERSANRMNIGQGTANTGSNTAALKGALQFDDRLQKKRSMLSGVLSNLGNILPNMKTNNFNYSAATGQLGRGAGQQQFQSSLQNPQSLAANLASNAFGQGGSMSMNNANIQHSEIPQWQQTLGAVYGGLNAIGSVAGAAAGAACWVAEELFGVDNIKTHMARLYVKANPNTWFNKLYIKHGKAWANWLKCNPWAKPFVKPIWEIMAIRGSQLLNIDLNLWE